MAQRARGPAGGLPERYGLRGRKGPVMAAVVAAAGLAVVGALLLPGRGGGFEVTRAEAGGLAEDADTTRINLAASLSDGQKVYVPRQGEETPEDVAQDAGGAEDAATGAAGGAVGAAGDSAGSGTVDINTADATELQRLPGVGEATAAAIVEDRTRNGPFASPEDIMRVSGIGEKKFERMRAMIRV